MLSTVSEEMLLVVMRHTSVRLHEVETVVILTFLGHGNASGYGSTSLCRLALHPFKGFAFGTFGNAFGMGAETCRKHFRQHIEIASWIAVNRVIGSLYVHGGIRPFDISL